jgi:hypothetical protein
VVLYRNKILMKHCSNCSSISKGKEIKLLKEKPQPSRQESIRNPFFLRPMLPRMLTSSNVTGSRTMSSSRVRMMSGFDGHEKLLPADAGVGELTYQVTPGGLVLVFANLRDEPL